MFFAARLPSSRAIVAQTLGRVLPRCGTVVRSPATKSVTSSLSTFSAAQSACAPTIRRFSSAVSHSAQVRDVSGLASSVESSELRTFSDLGKLGVSPALIDTIQSKFGYEEMTPVQAKSIRPAMAGRDLVAQAKTGTGKTLGFLIPIFNRIIDDQPSLAQPGFRRRATPGDIKAIVMSPTRELAQQLATEAKRLASGTSIVVQCAVGGTQKRESLQQMQRRGCDILIATPGRLQDILSDPYAGVAAPNLQVLVLDEADRMLDIGFADAIRDIANLLPKPSEVPRQTLLYSATIPSSVVSLARDLVDASNFEFVQTIDPDDEPTHARVKQHVVKVQGLESIMPTVVELTERIQKERMAEDTAKPFKAMVFFNTTILTEFASDLFNTLRKMPTTALPPRILHIHSRLTQGQRTRAADTFREADSALLITSDVTARGMDFPNVTHVFQVGLPRDRDTYIHRLGRTGRQGKEGEGWLILLGNEVPQARKLLDDIPLKPNHTVEAAKHDVEAAGTDAEPHPTFAKVHAAIKTFPKRQLRETFEHMLNVTQDAHECTRMATAGWGLPEPPPVAARAIRNVPRVRGLTVDDDAVREWDGVVHTPMRGQSFGRGRNTDRSGRRFEGGRMTGRGGFTNGPRRDSDGNPFAGFGQRESGGGDRRFVRERGGGRRDGGGDRGFAGERGRGMRDGGSRVSRWEPEW